MTRRYFNWELAIVLVISFVVLFVTAFALHRWRITNRAEQGLILGNKAYEDKRWEEAARNLGQYIAVERNDVPMLLKYADAQLQVRPSKRNNITQAIETYRIVLRVDKNNSEAAMRLVEIYLMVGMSGEAELIAKRQLETNDDPKLRRMLASALIRQRNINEAIVELNTIIQDHPDQILAYETLGQLKEQHPENFPDPTTHWFNEAVTNNPSSALAYIIRAGFHRRSNDNNKALTDLKQAEKNDLTEPTIRLRLAEEYINANMLDKAEEHLSALQASTPTNQNLWQVWTRLALTSQSQEKMLKVAETGLKELSSQPWDFMPTATDLFIRCDQLDRANECISKMKQKDISPATVSFLEGFIAVKKGHMYDAVNYWQDSLALGNKTPQVRLGLASAFSNLDNRQAALEHLRALVSERPDYFPGWLALAKHLARMRNWGEAAEYATTAMRLSPEHPEPALIHLRARTELLAKSPAKENVQLWQEIEKQLSVWDKATNGALEVKLLQFRIALLQDKYTDAHAVITQLKNDYSQQIRIAMGEVELLVAQEKTNEAISLLYKTIEEFPQEFEPTRYLAFLLNRQGDREECESILKKVLGQIEQPLDQRKLGLLLVQFYTQWNQKNNAYQVLESLAQKIPNDIPIKRRLLICEQVINDPERTQKIVNDIKSLEGEDGWQWRYEQARGWFIADDFKSRYPQIVSLLQEILLANPSDQASRLLLARSYERAGELQLAISTYREGLNRSPDDINIIIPTIAALYGAKEYDQAEELLARVSQQKLDHPQLQQLKLQSYLRRGELTSASGVLEDFLSHDPNNKTTRLSLALLKMQQAQFDEAEVLLDELKAQSPDSLPVTYAQVQLNIRQDKAEEALRLCNELINHLDNASAYILRARTYTTLKQIDKAVEDLTHATAVEPNNITVWIARSEFYRSIGRLNEAIADIQQALFLNSGDIQIQKRAIQLLFVSGDIDNVNQGKTLLEQALQSNPDDIDLRLLKVNLLLTEGTALATENAAGILKRITDDNPSTSRAWGLLGNISLRQGNLSKAMDAALRGLAHTPKDKTLLLLKARLEAAKSPLLAIPTYKMLLEQDPNDTNTIILLADAYISAGQPEKAVNLLREQLVSITSMPDRRRINIALAMALHKSGDETNAQKEFDFLLESEPNNPDQLFAQVQLLRDDQLWRELNLKVRDWYQKNPEDSRTPIIIARSLVTTDDEQVKAAEDILRMILERNSDSIEAMTNLAILLHNIGRSDESVSLYQRILELDPDNVITINNLAWLLSEEKGQLQQALELTQKGLKISPNYIDLIDTRGVVYYRMGEFKKAVEDFTKCIQLYPTGNPASVASRFHLARAFAALGQKDKAVEHLTQALDANNRSQISGLSTKDIAEALHLLRQLQEGN